MTHCKEMGGLIPWVPLALFKRGRSLGAKAGRLGLCISWSWRERTWVARKGWRIRVQRKAGSLSSAVG